MILERNTFVKFLAYALVGFLFYYAGIYFGLFESSMFFKIMAVTFFLVTLPLPSAVMNNRKLFPELKKSAKRVLAFGAILLIFHHFLLSFVVVLLMQGNGVS